MYSSLKESFTFTEFNINRVLKRNENLLNIQINKESINEERAFANFFANTIA